MARQRLPSKGDPIEIQIQPDLWVKAVVWVLLSEQMIAVVQNEGNQIFLSFKHEGVEWKRV